MDLILKIRNEYSKFSDTNRRISDYALNNSKEFLDMTAVEIGDKTSTSSASVIRYTKSLGCDSLDQFKRQLAIELSDNTKLVDPIIKNEDTIVDISEKVSSIVKNSMDDLFFVLNKDSLYTAVEKIRSADKIFIYGSGASSLPAYDLFHKFNRINRLTYFNFDNHMNLEFLRHSKKNDVVITFSYSGNSMETVLAAQEAKALGLTVISICSDESSELMKHTDILLQLPKDEPIIRVGAITSKINSMIIADLLYLGTISGHLEDVEDYLVETNRMTSGLKIKKRK